MVLGGEEECTWAVDGDVDVTGEKTTRREILNRREIEILRNLFYSMCRGQEGSGSNLGWRLAELAEL